MKKRCSGCKKDQDEQMFIDGKAVRATCFNCQSSNKMRKKQSRNPSRSENEEGNEIFEKPLIEFEELTDELLLAMDEHTSSCDKENLEIEYATSFNFEKIINTNSLSGDPKTIASQVEQMSLSQNLPGIFLAN
ncbi:unnamed protein product [Rhizophagus irregularis]|nr:unnamed protein product [Rhizophagus irregularis]CAB4443325.1 unnamed protein product [Rhizophagus irregularis]